MERRVTSHTEEEEMNQRRRLLTLARKGDQKSIELLFELYQVKVFSGEALKKKKLPSFPVLKTTNGSGKSGVKGSKNPKNKEKVSKVSLKTTKPTNGKQEKPESSQKGLTKTKAKTETGQSPVKKSTKLALRNKPVAKKASLPKKKSSAKQLKVQKSKAIKPRISKKK